MIETLPNHETMSEALYSRDESFDGIFIVGVRTTSIFCRPSCHARKPKPENVVFFSNASAALFAGFRPCRKCRPLEIDPIPEWADELLKIVEEDPSRRLTAGGLRELGIDPARARRFFQKRFGLSFHAYLRSRRMGNALAQIREGRPLDDVALGNGYESHSGFREAFGKTFGTAPGKGEELVAIVTRLYQSPLGSLVLGATDKGLCLLEFSDRRMLERQFRILRRRVGSTILPGSNEHIDRAESQLHSYFAGELTEFDLQLDCPGTAFQKTVWDAVASVPFGETRTYEEIATGLGSPKAVRAVGNANGMNRIAIVIPCHRIVAKNGTLGGYGGGLWRKKRLLALEQG